MGKEKPVLQFAVLIFENKPDPAEPDADYDALTVRIQNRHGELVSEFGSYTGHSLEADFERWVRHTLQPALSLTE